GRGALRAPCGRPWSPCARGNHDGACAPACSVGRSASPGLSPLAVAATGSPWRRRIGRISPVRHPITAIGRGCRLFQVPRLIREGSLGRQCKGGCPLRCREKRPIGPTNDVNMSSPEPRLALLDNVIVWITGSDRAASTTAATGLYTRVAE